jgi:hypothetical protein
VAKLRVVVRFVPGSELIAAPVCRVEAWSRAFRPPERERVVFRAAAVSARAGQVVPPAALGVVLDLGIEGAGDAGEGVEVHAGRFRQIAPAEQTHLGVDHLDVAARPDGPGRVGRGALAGVVGGREPLVVEPGGDGRVRAGADVEGPGRQRCPERGPPAGRGPLRRSHRIRIQRAEGHRRAVRDARSRPRSRGEEPSPDGGRGLHPVARGGQGPGDGPRGEAAGEHAGG